MATCDLGFDHDDLAPAEAEAAPVVIESGTSENDVAIAEIEAAASIEREKLYTVQRGMELEIENERLRGELAGLKEAAAVLAPPEPEPVVTAPVAIPAPAEPAEPVVQGPPMTGPAKGKKAPGWWDGYR